MRPLSFAACLLTLAGLPASQATRPLVWPATGPGPTVRLRPFVHNGRWGYLDSTATVRVAARFLAAGEFGEGLAAVRDGGRYGFVNAAGQLALSAQYDYATEFVGGYALVWVAGRPQLINHQGTNVLPAGLAEVRRVPVPGCPGHLAVQTTAGRHGLLAPDGQWLVDTLYSEVGPLREGRVAVERYFSPAERDQDTGPLTRALLDDHGHVLVPFGPFSGISDFADGLAAASRYTLQSSADEEYTEEDCIIDRRGLVVAVLPQEGGARLQYDAYSPAFQEQLVRAVFPARPASAARHGEAPPEYAGVLGTRGQVVFSDPELALLSDFAEGRAFARTHDDTFFLVDRTGRRLNKEPIVALFEASHSQLPTPHFINGRQVVKVAGGYVLLDRLGHLTGPPRQFSFPYDHMAQMGELVVFWATGETKAGRYSHCGFWNPATGVVVPPRFDGLDPAGFRHGLLAVLQADRRAYLNPAGKVIWQQAADNKEASSRLNIDFMSRSSYAASSPKLAQYNGFGGWGRADNAPRPVPGGAYPPGRLHVQLAPTPRPQAYQQHYAGHELAIANTTADTVVFDAQDSQLFANLQARDEYGRWRNVEYVPSSFCGNSYHQLFLAPGQQWTFTVPAYTGSQPTRLRLKVTVLRDRETAPKRVVYSNEVAGSINPAQFWRQPGYSPTSIMDPYLN